MFRRDTATVTGVLEIVVEALLDCLMFLELGDDEAVNPDDAVRQMEWVAHLLGDLSPADRQHLTELAEARAAREEDPDRREFLLDFPEAFGLVNAD
jgi:hypothetical protein